MNKRANEENWPLEHSVCGDKKKKNGEKETIWNGEKLLEMLDNYRIQNSVLGSVSFVETIISVRHKKKCETANDDDNVDDEMETENKRQNQQKSQRKKTLKKCLEKEQEKTNTNMSSHFHQDVEMSREEKNDE